MSDKQNFDCVAANEAVASLDKRQRAQAIIAHAFEAAPGPHVVSTNFRPGEAVILHLLAQYRSDIPVLWIDHGYNTPETYRCAEAVIQQLQLNVHLVLPARSRAHREAINPMIPDPDTDEHLAFTEELKLEPFRRGLRELAPQTWFTALRSEQTAFRAGLEAFEWDQTGLTDHDLLKVCPLLDWTEADMSAYLARIWLAR